LYTEIGLEEVGEMMLKCGNDAQLAIPSPSFERCVRNADVFISAWGGNNVKVLANVPPEALKARALAAKENYGIYFKRTGDGSLRWCGALFPNQANAQEANMSLSEYEEFVYSSCGISDGVDTVEYWTNIEKEQQKWVDYLNEKSVIRCVSDRFDLTVGVKGRKWINCCGHANFPDGEIFTSPIRDEVNGRVAFSFPAIYQGQEVENVILEIKDGKVVNASADKGETFLHTILDTDESARYFGEFAIGTNYGIKKFSKNILFDEKIGGTFHMALGNGMEDAKGGGADVNRSAIHWDMIGDMRNGAEMYADGELFYRDGRFLR
jgi:aminopeptidase